MNKDFTRKGSDFAEIGPLDVGGGFLLTLEWIFRSHYREGIAEFVVHREEIMNAARDSGFTIPKPQDAFILQSAHRYEFQYTIQDITHSGNEWTVRLEGNDTFHFAESAEITRVLPTRFYATSMIPDSTPRLVLKYALTDEQALLARLRYNRLVDVFTRATCYSLQNHLRSHVKSLGQIEVDEIYVGVDRKGVHYVFPVQAKGGRDRINLVQIKQDMAFCAARFPALICRPIAAQFMSESVIALFEFMDTEEGPRLVCEKHYKLVPPEDISDAELKSYGAADSANE